MVEDVKMRSVDANLVLTSNAWSIGLKGYKDIGRLDTVLFGKFHNDRIGEKRGVVGAEGRVGGDNDA